MSEKPPVSVFEDKPMGTFEGQLAGLLDANQLPAAADTQAREATSTAIADLVHEYSGTLYRVAFSVTRNAAEAEDVVQDTFLRVLKHRDELPGIRDARVWLVRITWNLVLDRKRRSKTRPENEDIADLVRVLPAKDMSAEKALIAGQRHARVLALIDKLPRKERETLLLCAVEELSTIQVAAVLNTSESSVRSRLFRARRDLASLLRKEGIAR
ncbi:MAG: RNA polymerase sigma factor [Acidobacteriaceae bacterium]